MKKYEHIPLKNLLPYFSLWKEILDVNEVGQIFTVPYADAQYRAYQFQEWIQQNHSMSVAVLDLAAQMIDDEFALTEYLYKQDTHIIIIARSELHRIEDIYKLHTLESFNLTKQRGLLIFHEGFPSTLNMWKQKLPNGLVQNISKFPMYSQDVLVHFLQLLVEDWDMDISVEEKQEIFKYSGGNLWIAKSLLRSKRRDSTVTLDKIIESEDILWKRKQFWESLPNSHKLALVEQGSDPTVDAELSDFGFYIDKKYTLPGFLQTMVDEYKNISTIIKKTDITVNSKSLTHAFSKKERKVLAYFYASIDTVISRDQVAEIYWGDTWESQYSDWALDKIVSRLRNKISQYGIPMTIETKRGQGYVSRRFF